jgi:hypothetical protein
MVVAEKLTPVEARADVGKDNGWRRNDHEGRLATKEHRERKKRMKEQVVVQFESTKASCCTLP